MRMRRKQKNTENKMKQWNEKEKEKEKQWSAHDQSFLKYERILFSHISPLFII
jgi:hypothetical protein